MEDVEKFTFILERYQIPYQTPEKDVLLTGSGQNLKLIQLYYFYLPFSIGVLIILISYLLNFMFFMYVGAPFIVYSVYGLFEIYKARKQKSNMVLIKNGELTIIHNKAITLLKADHIKNYKITTEPMSGTLQRNCIFIIDQENKEYLLWTMVDDEPQELNNNMKTIESFLRMKMKNTNV